MIKAKSSIPLRIKRLLRTSKPGYVFTPYDLLSFGSREAIDKALGRLTQANYIERIGQGLYYFPKISPTLGRLNPSTDEIARAMARQTGSLVQPIGAAAANALGLTTQVPARALYATNGSSRRRRVGKVVVELRRAGPRTLAGGGTRAGSVLHALRYLGKSNISKDTIRHIDSQLSPEDRRRLKALMRAAPEWMRPFLDPLMQEVPNRGELG
jgi:hypothetical protein